MSDKTSSTSAWVAIFGGVVSIVVALITAWGNIASKKDVEKTKTIAQKDINTSAKDVQETLKEVKEAAGRAQILAKGAERTAGTAVATAEEAKNAALAASKIADDRLSGGTIRVNNPTSFDVLGWTGRVFTPTLEDSGTAMKITFNKAFEGDPFVLVAWSDNHGGSIRWEAIDNKTGRVLFFDGKGERMNMSAYFRKFFFVAFETADQK